MSTCLVVWKLRRKAFQVSVANASQPANALTGRMKEHASGPGNAGWLRQAHTHNTVLAMHLLIVRGLPGQSVAGGKAPSIQPEDSKAHPAHHLARLVLLRPHCLHGHNVRDCGPPNSAFRPKPTSCQLKNWVSSVTKASKAFSQRAFTHLSDHWEHVPVEAHLGQHTAWSPTAVDTA